MKNLMRLNTEWSEFFPCPQYMTTSCEFTCFANTGFEGIFRLDLVPQRLLPSGSIGEIHRINSFEFDNLAGEGRPYLRVFTGFLMTTPAVFLDDFNTSPRRLSQFKIYQMLF